MPDSYNITHSPSRAVAGKYPDDHWNRLLRNVYIGIVKHFTEAGVDDPVIDEPHLTLDKVHEVCIIPECGNLETSSSSAGKSEF